MGPGGAHDALTRCERDLTRLQVIILDPTVSQVIRRRVSDRHRNPRYDGRSDDSLVEALRNEIYMAVVALFDCRDVCAVEIAYASETSVVRVEMVDDALYMALYLTEQSSRQPFPEALRYSRESIHSRVSHFRPRRQPGLPARGGVLPGWA
jgi:hypothetical protein